MSSGVVERDIMRCSRSHVKSPCTNTSTDLQDTRQTEHQHPLLHFMCTTGMNLTKNRMWADAQRDGPPTEYR